MSQTRPTFRCILAIHEPLLKFRDDRSSGGEETGRLLIKKDGKPPIIGLTTGEQAVSRDRQLHEVPSKV